MNRLFFVFLFLVSVPCFAGELPETQLLIKTAEEKSYAYNVELALTEEQQAKGLMSRNDLAENAGMLFVFPDVQERQFWMKNTLIPLDMLFIGVDGTILHIAENTVPLDLTPVPSQKPAKAVLEIKGGQAAEKGLKTGDIIHHSIFGNSLAE